MTFPVHFNLFGLHVHPHALFELLAYTCGFQLYLLLRRRWARAAVPLEANLWLLVGCVFGALAGAKLLAWLESPMEYWHNREHLAALLGGKTIVGGLLGGWAGVELVKKRLGVTHSTGDVYVFPLALGMCLGRVGCFLTGLADRTYGVHSALPWAVDFGDGPRHPTQLYEIAFLFVLAAFIALRMTRPHENGVPFRLFMLGYLVFRFAVEFIKPVYAPYLGLSMIQLACLAGVACCAWSRAKRPAPLPQPVPQMTEAA